MAKMSTKYYLAKNVLARISPNVITMILNYSDTLSELYLTLNYEKGENQNS